MLSKILQILIASLLFYSCSMVGLYSTYRTTDGAKYNGYDGRIRRHIHNDMYYKPDTTERCSMLADTPIAFYVIRFYCSDSISFYMEDFPGNKDLLIGPPFLPILPIPLILNPVFYHLNNEESTYHVIISHSVSDSISVYFYRNNKIIIPKSIEIIDFRQQEINGIYYVRESLDDDSQNVVLYPSRHYLFTFILRKFTTKEIEIRYNNNKFKVKRKKRLFHEIIFAS